jgi:hypothetical protein
MNPFAKAAFGVVRVTFEVSIPSLFFEDFGLTYYHIALEEAKRI